MKIILASGSPRRKEIMDLVEAEYEVKACNKEEVITSTIPEDVVKELALMKAAAVYEEIKEEDILVIGADTVVASEGTILGKPKDEEDACRMLASLQGKTHEVYTGVALVIRTKGETKQINFSVGTKVSISSMSESEIKSYVNTKEPLDKAGAYAIQGKFSPYIEGLEGDYYNVVGFPIASICRRLKQEGIDLIGYGK